MSIRVQIMLQYKRSHILTRSGDQQEKSNQFHVFGEITKR